MQRLANIITGRKNFRRPEACQPIVHELTAIACLVQRKKTLLVEYRQLRKANAFVDRRFGEEDESLTAEEKAIARFQKQRMKEFGGELLHMNKQQ